MEPSWAGSLECSECGGKRMIADKFSKKMLDKRRADEKAKLRCKECVEKAAAAERDAAAARQAASCSEGAGDATTLHTCSACAKELAASAFNRNQLGKGPGKQRCRSCVAAAEEEAAGAGSAARDAAIEAARRRLAQVEVSGSVAEKLAASNDLAALEAQKVTGLKPVVLGNGRGRGRGGRFGRGRGRGS